MAQQTNQAKARLATGMTNRRHTSGFTLIEMLVVIIIISIITAVAAMVFHNFGRTRRTQVAIQTLKNTILLAQQQSILKRIVLRLQFTDRGYQFTQWKSNTTTNNVLSKSNAFDSGTRFIVKPSQNALALPKELTSKQSPLILFLPNGAVTPFTIQFNVDGKIIQLSVNSSGQGVIK